MAYIVEHLPSKCETLSSNPNMIQTPVPPKKKERKKENQTPIQQNVLFKTKIFILIYNHPYVCI
jgi:hypothetical protein